MTKAKNLISILILTLLMGPGWAQEALEALEGRSQVADLLEQFASENDPHELSRMAEEMGSHRYREVFASLVAQVESQLQSDRPNTYVLNACFKSMAKIGNPEALSYLERKIDSGEVASVLQGHLSEKVAPHVIKGFENAKSEMAQRTHDLLFLFPENEAAASAQASGSRGGGSLTGRLRQTLARYVPGSGASSRGGGEAVPPPPPSPGNQQGSAAEGDQPSPAQQSGGLSFRGNTNRNEGESYEDWLNRLKKWGGSAKVLNDASLSVLNDEVKTGGLTVYGRENESRELMEMLARFKSRSPVLVGPAGVGKTAVVLKLAQMIERGEINPDRIFDPIRGSMILETTPARISTLAKSDMPNAQASALEQYIDAVEDFQRRYNKNIIVFIDELHSLGKAQVEALKPYLDSASHRLYFIGASTHAEFELKFKNNSAAQRRFSLVPIEQFSREQVLEIIQESWYPVLEREYDVKFDQVSTEAIVDKAIFMQGPGGPIDTAIKTMQDIAIDARAANPNSDNLVIIGEEETFTFLQERMKYPVNPNDGPEFKSFLDRWRTELNERVLGQPEAIDAVLKNLSILISDDSKRISPLLLLGPTGVGKTLLGNSIATVVFENPKAVYEIDATAHQTGGYSLNSLFGAPNGVISSDQTSGKLIEWLEYPAQGKNGGVLVINEIERAPKDFIERFMEFFDRGVVTGGDGKERMANNLLVIVTSNKGQEILYPQGIHGWSPREIKSHLRGFSQNDLRGLFTDLDSAILGRIDEIVLTNPIDEETAKGVAQQTIEHWVDEFTRRHHVAIAVHDDFVDKILDMEFNINEGARPLKRRAEHLLSRVREALYQWKLERGDTVGISLRDQGNEYILQVLYNGELSEVETGLTRKVHPLDDGELRARIQNLDRMNERIFGQEEMVRSVKEVVVSHYSTNNRKRALSFAPIGMTGMGKTELGKALAWAYFGNEERYVEISLGHIQHEYQLNDIFGVPVGIVGSKDVSLFERGLRDNAQGGVFIFDEFSNMGAMSPTIRDGLTKYFYHIMDNQYWHSVATGRDYDLSRYIFMFTGNDGEKIFKGMPYDLQMQIWRRYNSSQKTAALLREGGVPDAFIGRLSDIVLVKPLSEEAIAQISGKFLTPIIEDLRGQGIDLVIPEEVKGILAESFYLPERGSRSIRSFVEDILAGYINGFLIENRERGIRRVEVAINDSVPFAERFDRVGEVRRVMLALRGSAESGEVVAEGEREVTHKVSQRLLITREYLAEIAVHEAGHALVGHDLGLPIELVSIRSANGVGGVVAQGEDPLVSIGRKFLTSRVAGALAGRRAEVEMGYSLNMGWGNDLDQAKQMIQEFVIRHKETDVLFHPRENQGNPQKKEVRLTPKEKREAEEIYSQARRLAGVIITERRGVLEDLRDELLERFVMDKEEFKAFMAERGPRGEETQRALKGIGWLADLDAVLWGNHDQLSLRFVRDKLLASNISNEVDNLDDIASGLRRVIEQGGTETLTLIAREVLTQKIWAPYPELVEALVQYSSGPVRNIISEYTLRARHWQTSSRLREISNASSGTTVTIHGILEGGSREPPGC